MLNIKCKMEMCFHVAEQLLTSTMQFGGIVNLIIDSFSALSGDAMIRECKSVLIKIQSNMNFNKRNKGSN